MLASASLFASHRRRTDVAGEHVGPTHGIDFSSERLRDRGLDETFLQSDAKLADENLHDVARALSVDFSQQFGEDAFLFVRAGRLGDAIEILAELGERDRACGIVREVIGQRVASIAMLRP